MVKDSRVLVSDQRPRERPASRSQLRSLQQFPCRHAPTTYPPMSGAETMHTEEEIQRAAELGSSIRPAWRCTTRPVCARSQRRCACRRGSRSRAGCTCASQRSAMGESGSPSASPAKHPASASRRRPAHRIACRARPKVPSPCPARLSDASHRRCDERGDASVSRLCCS